MLSPCFNCKDRYPGCSGKCQKEEYKEFKQKVEKARQLRNDNFRMVNDLFSISHVRRRKNK